MQYEFLTESLAEFVLAYPEYTILMFLLAFFGTVFMAFLLAYRNESFWSAVKAILIGGTEFIRCYLRHRRDRKKLPEVGQLWSNLADWPVMEVSQVYGPKAEEGVGFRAHLPGNQFRVISCSLKEWNEYRDRRMLLLVEKRELAESIQQQQIQ